MMYRSEAEWRQSKGFLSENLPVTKKTGKPRRNLKIADNGLPMEVEKWNMSDEDWIERQREKHRRTYRRIRNN